MKKTLAFLLLLSFQLTMAQTEKVTATEPLDPAHAVGGIELKPEFPGGPEAFYKYVATNFRLPRKKNLEGKVYATFIVEKDGTVSNVKINRALGYGTGEEAKRVLENSPRWAPGMQNGKTVRVQYALPITVNTK
jgi:periplasmic protein TonB